MSSIRLSALLAIPLIGALGCTGQRRTVSAYNLMDTITVSARNNPMDIYRSTSPRIWEIYATEAKIRPDWMAREAEGEVILRFASFNAPQDTLHLDAKDMVIRAVKTLNGKILSYRYDTSQLHIAVNSLFDSADQQPQRAAIQISYRARPYARASGGSAAIKEDRGLYFINTDGATPGKPRQIWTQGETESNSNWLPTIDKPNQRTKITLSVEVPDTMKSLGNGRFISSTPSRAGYRMDTWRTDTAIQVYAIMFAIGRYDKTTHSLKLPTGRDIEVAYFTEPEYTPYADGIFRNTPEMISYFSKVTGVPYPWEKYSQITARDYVSGAMENTSASLFGEFVNQNNRQLIDATTEDVVSHELFHQWFGDYVTAESWSNLTVNESFATFGEIIWREHKYGVDNAAELAYEDLARYLSAAERLDPPLVRFHYRDKEEMFDRVSYQKGGAILRYIRSICGDSAFNRAMKIYLTEHALQSAEATNWRLALEKATGQDWTPFFNEWYFRGGHPDLQATHTYDDAAGKLTIRIRQRNRPDSARLYTMPLEFNYSVTAASDGVVTGEPNMVTLSHTETRTIARRSEDFVFPYTNGKRPSVVIDPQRYLPGTIEEIKPMESWLAQMSYTGYGARRLALNKALKQQKDPFSVKIYAAALKDNDPATRVYALSLLSSVTDPSWQEALKPQIKYMLQTETRSKPLSAAYRVAGSWNLGSERSLMREAVWDSSYFVAGAALTALSRIDKDTAYKLARLVVPTQPRSALADAAWMIIGKHGERQDFGLLERYSTGLYGVERIRMMQRMSYFASETTDDTLYRRGLERIIQEARLEQEPGARAGVGTIVIRMRRYYEIEARKKGRDAELATRRAQWAKELETAMIAAEKDPAAKERLEQAARGGNE